jgi:hypothetical protein
MHMVAPTTTSLPEANPNLLFGALALHLGYLDAARFAEACSVCSAGSASTLAELVVARGWLTAAQREEVERRLHPCPAPTPPPPRTSAPEPDGDLDLPIELTAEEAVERAYPGELADITACLERGLSVLVECEKDLTSFLWRRVANRATGLQFDLLDDRPRRGSGGVIAVGPVAGMLAQMRDAVSGPVARHVFVLPHLDLLTAGPPVLGREARDVIPLLYENPEVVWLAFKDPLLALPPMVMRLFSHFYRVGDVHPARLRHLVTRREARKFGRPFDVQELARHLEGLHAVRIRRVLGAFDREDYPADPRRAYEQLARWRGTPFGA